MLIIGNIEGDTLILIEMIQDTTATEMPSLEHSPMLSILELSLISNTSSQVILRNVDYQYNVAFEIYVAGLISSLNNNVHSIVSHLGENVIHVNIQFDDLSGQEKVFLVRQGMLNEIYSRNLTQTEQTHWFRSSIELQNDQIFLLTEYHQFFLFT